MLNRRNASPFLRLISGALYDLPCAPNLSVFWTFGSLLGACLISQIFSGLLLAMHYTPCSDLAFASVVHIIRDVNSGWMIRLIHANGASLFFGCVYLHIGRGLYYGSYKCLGTWTIGVTILVVSMAIAFMGYVLPWGQMSYWGASVITNLFSVVPVIGKDLVEWLWGGFTVCNATLQRFFVFHFFLPFVLVCLGVIHLVYLHEVGGGNPLGVDSAPVSVSFHPHYTWSDLTGILSGAWLLFLVCCFCPFCLMDPSNLIPANSMVTPSHIQPEWYFLFAYSILRAVPNKGGGVIALLASVGILYLVPALHLGNFRTLSFYPVNQVLFWVFVANFVFLSWLGSCPVEEPFVLAGQISSIVYFGYFFFGPVLIKLQDLFLEYGR